jgi:nitroreductase
MSALPLTDHALNQLFRQARSFNYWLDRPVTDEQLRQLYELVKFGPTASNSCPARFVFVKSAEAKERLKPCLDEGNVNKSMTAPAVAIIGMDLEFYEKFPVLWPQSDKRAGFVGQPDKIKASATRNSTLQAAYFILAARSLGLDCGPMTGFDAQKLDAEFFPDGKIKSNMLCAIGYGDRGKLHPRRPRLRFEDTCRIE